MSEANQFLATLIIGFTFLIPPMISFTLIYKKFYQDFRIKTIDGYKVPEKDRLYYKHSLIPMIFAESFLCLLLLVNMLEVLKDSCNHGLTVWNRDTIGVHIQNLCLHVCLILSFNKYY
jgi:cellulose synthase/poly-beta-1,6-N-acetylglucosamine synthase-like glycosyltransferase